MGWVKDNFFGGAAKEASKQQTAALEEAQALTQEGVAQARSDINQLFPMAQQNILSGATGAMDVFNQTAPQQMQLAQQGNVNAQQALLAGLPQMQNALLGNSIDYSGMQAQQQALPQFNYSMPQFQMQEQQAQEQPQQQQVDTQAIMNALSGGGFSGLSNIAQLAGVK